ncbi:MAG: porin family protein [Candidatus Azobacteroides sp.]|nr:porin family protein [Candidatus Azobacteroides sp.]
MKKMIFALLFVILSVHAFSQSGDLTIGAKGGYVFSTDYYKGILYGFDVAYHLADPLEVAFTGLFNPDISYTNPMQVKKQLSVYSANLDLRLYLIHHEVWATGPTLGGQYYVVDDKSNEYGADKAWGFNMGWHLRVNLTDNVKINGGYRYTNANAKDRNSWDDSAKFPLSHHLIYLGVAYTFELK